MTEIGWSNVVTIQGCTNKFGETESVVLAQCPKCAAVVWDANKLAHELWHEDLASDG